MEIEEFVSCFQPGSEVLERLKTKPQQRAVVIKQVTRLLSAVTTGKGTGNMAQFQKLSHLLLRLEVFDAFYTIQDCSKEREDENNLVVLV
jgi:hypothetical protein